MQYPGGALPIDFHPQFSEIGNLQFSLNRYAEMPEQTVKWYKLGSDGCHGSLSLNKICIV